jgi:hypothetical protein
MAADDATQRSFREMLMSAKTDATRLAKAQVELAQLEVKQDGQTVGKTAGLFIGAGVLAFLAFVFLLVTLAYVLIQLGLPAWAGFLIVTLLLIIVAVVLGLLGRREVGRIKGMERSKESFAATQAALSGRTDTGSAA